MLWPLLLSLPLFWFTVTGLFHVIELGFLAGAVEQGSFFAARSDLVDEQGAGLAEKSAHYISEVSLPRDMTVRIGTSSGFPEAVTRLEDPRSLPFGNPLLAPALTGHTPVPEEP